MTRFQAGLGAAALALAAHLQAADLHVVSGGAAQRVLQRLAPQFESATGTRIQLDFAVVGAIEKKLAEGGRADVLLLPVPQIDGLEKSGAFHVRSRTIVGRVAIGVVTREGAATPDISTPDAVRKTLLEARSVVFPDPKVTPSGSHLMRMLAQMDIAEAMRPKLTFRNAIDGGVGLVRDGQAEIGLFLVTEALPVKGIALVGTLPAALQGYVVYGAAVAADAAEPEVASRFLEFLTDPARRESWREAGFDFPTTTQRKE